MNADDDSIMRARLKLLLVALVFFGPLAAAWVLYFGFPGAVPQQKTNHGHLLQPVRPLPDFNLRKTGGGTVAASNVFDEVWTLLYVGPSDCGETCRKRLYDTRQVRTALHRRAPRVQRVFVATDTGSLDALRDFVADKHPDLQVLVVQGKTLQKFLDQTVSDAGSNGNVYVLDPHGNWVLYYRPGDAAEGMLKDLEHLLRISQIG